MRLKHNTDILNVIESRRSINNFDPLKSIDEETINEIVEYATKAPSAFNLQNWSFIAVKSTEQKAKLQELAYGQQKVADASVTFIVAGLLEPQDLIANALVKPYEQGVISQEIVDGWVGAVNGMYANNAELQRDEAIRSASLASMTLMFAAEAMGFVSCPMIGFDANGVKQHFALPDQAVPAMLITVGHEADGNWQQKPRFDTNSVLNIV